MPLSGRPRPITLPSSGVLQDGREVSTVQLPAWLRVTVLVLAVLAAFDDIRSLADDLLPRAETVLLMVQVVACYGAVALLAFRLSFSVAAMTAGYAMSIVTGSLPSTMLCATILTLAVVCTATPRLLTVHLGLSAAWILACVLRSMHTDLLWVLGTPLLAGGLVGAAVRYFLVQHRVAAYRLQAMEAAHERLREQERLALARDLHDVVAHELTLVTMQAAGAHRQSDPEKLHATITTMEEAARSGLQELRFLLQVLRDSPGSVGEAYRDDSASGLTTGSLNQLMDSLRASLRSAGFTASCTVHGSVEALPTTVRGTVARILQEATTNVIKYAPPGSECSSQVTVTESEVEIDTTNELSSRRTDTAPSPLRSGFGLRGIQERVALLNGHVDYGPDNGRWHMHVRIPFA